MLLVTLAATAFIQHYSATNFFMQLPQPQPQPQPQLFNFHCACRVLLHSLPIGLKFLRSGLLHPWLLDVHPWTMVLFVVVISSELAELKARSKELVERTDRRKPKFISSLLKVPLWPQGLRRQIEIQPVPLTGSSPHVWGFLFDFYF